MRWILIRLLAVHAELNRLRDMAGVGIAPGQTETAAVRECPAPACLFGAHPDHVGGPLGAEVDARVLGHQLGHLAIHGSDQELDMIAPRGERQLVHEALRGEDLGVVAGRAPGAGGDPQQEHRLAAAQVRRLDRVFRLSVRLAPAASFLPSAVKVMKCSRQASSLPSLSIAPLNWW